MHETSSSLSAECEDHDPREMNDLDYAEHLLSMPLLPPGLSKSMSKCDDIAMCRSNVMKFTELRNEAIRRSIPTTHSASLMSRIEDKIKTEVALETMEISKTELYLPPVHKRRQEPWIEKVDARSLSPKNGLRSRVFGLSEQDEYVQQKKMLMKKYNFPSDIPIPKTPREMEETYAFTAQQLKDANEASMHAKQRDKRGAKKGNAHVDVGQVLKKAETLLQTAKLALRNSRLQMQDSVIITPTRVLESGARTASPSSLRTSPTVFTPEQQSSNQLNNSPVAQALNAVKKTASNSIVKPQTGPIIRIFKAELAPLPTPLPKHRKNVRTVDTDPKMKKLGSAMLENGLDSPAVKSDLSDTDSAPEKKTVFEMEKSAGSSNRNPQ